MIELKCKKCRRAGEKLFLKEGKCYTPKCPLVRKPYPPGFQSRSTKRPKRGSSEFGTQLKEKQKLKFLYFLRERQFKNYVKKALKTKGGNIPSKLAELLESRFDNIVFKLGFAKSRSEARQLVGHGHILVNGKSVDISSYSVKLGDKISIRPQSASKGKLKDIDLYFKKYEPPAWLKLNKEKKEGELVAKPQIEDIGTKANLNMIIEFYSR